MERAPSEKPVEPSPPLGEREAAVLRALVTAYVGEAAPIGSQTISRLLPVALSSASVRSILIALTERGLVEQPHTSAGRVPTERALRRFVDEILGSEPPLARYERQTIAFSVDAAAPDTLVDVASQLLSERTHQLGFVVAPRLDRVVLRHVSLVRLTRERVLAVLVSQTGAAHRRVLEERDLDQAELDRVAALLSERAAGHTLASVRAALAREAAQLRDRADHLLARAIALGSRALAAEAEPDADLVLGTRLALLDQPEFRDPRRVRDLFAALETKERLLELVERTLEGHAVAVLFGDEAGEPGLHRCALVAARYGRADAPLGALGVIGPSRMDYGRVIPLVEYLSHAVTEKLSA
jgi:heat-inducible transcriptional repressor